MTGNENGLHERLEAAVDGRSYRQLSDITGIHPETVRRYMQGQAPSAEFLAGLCSSLGLSAEWLLLGHGPMLSDEIRGHALGEASAADLLTAIASTLEGLIDRVDRVELFMQSLETKLHGARALLLAGENTDDTADVTRREPKPEANAPANTSDAIGDIADAVPE